MIWLVRKYDNPTYKISWIIVILLSLFGGLVLPAVGQHAV